MILLLLDLRLLIGRFKAFVFWRKTPLTNAKGPEVAIPAGFRHTLR